MNQVISQAVANSLSIWFLSLRCVSSVDHWLDKLLGVSLVCYQTVIYQVIMIWTPGGVKSA